MSEDKMIKFPSIEQFRSVGSEVHKKACYIGKDENGKAIYADRKKPTLEFEGTVKLHGSNAAIVFNAYDCSTHYQSRERILSLESDNFGFMSYMTEHDEAVRELKFLFAANYESDTTAIFGEWCGSNIQNGVGLSELPKMFVIFLVKIDGDKVDLNHFSKHHDMTLLNEHNVYFINQFPTFKMEIDFNDPKLVQNDLVEITTKVEECCPVAKHFGVEGVGEGVVWKCVTPGWESSDYWFKVKGDKHSSSKVTKLASVDIEKLRSLNDFINSVCTENRLQQGLYNILNEKLLPFEKKSMGDFIRWMHADIVKEESDTMEANGINVKDIGSRLSQVCKEWYIAKLNSK